MIELFHSLLRKYNSLCSLIREVHGQYGDDLCWMDIDLIFKEVGLPVPDRSVGDKEAMLENCSRFVNTMCTRKSYAELEQRVQKTTKWVELLPHCRELPYRYSS